MFLLNVKINKRMVKNLCILYEKEVISLRYLNKI